MTKIFISVQETLSLQFKLYMYNVCYAIDLCYVEWIFCQDFQVCHIRYVQSNNVSISHETAVCLTYV